jgi:hypothetical protein
MRWLQSIFHRFRSLFRKNAVERELDQELRFHLERQIAEHLATGMSYQDARRAVKGVEKFKRSAATRVGDLSRCLRICDTDPIYAKRSGPAVSVLTLALGIGANTAIFSMVNALLLHPYDFRNLDSLVRVWEDRGIDEGIDARYLAPADAEDLRAEQQFFEKLTTYSMQSFSMGAGSDIQPVLGCRVSADFFDVLGVRPATGRLFTAAEEQPGLDQVAIVGYGLWQRQFGGDPQLLNKTIFEWPCI